MATRHLNGVALGRGNRVGAAEADDIGPRQTRERLAERAAGEHVFEAEGLQGVEQHDVEIAGEAAVLEAVVQ